MTEQGPSPEWDSADLHGSFVAFVEWMHDEAKRVFLSDKTHVAMFYLLSRNGPAGLVPVPAGLDCDQIQKLGKKVIELDGIYARILVSEAYFYSAHGPHDHVLTQLKYGEMKIEDMREDDRHEALTVHAVSRDGLELMFADEIIREGDGVSFGEAIVRRSDV